MKRDGSLGLLNRFRSALVLILSAPVFLAPQILAHDEKVSATQIVVSGRSITWHIDVGLLGLEKVIRLPSSPAEITEAQLQSVKAEIAGYLQRGLRICINGQAITPEVRELEPIYEPFLLSGEPYIARARQEFACAVEGEIQDVSLKLRFYSEITRDHRALIQIRWGDAERKFVRVGPATLNLTYSRVSPTFWSTTADFTLWGAHHIFIGYDHIAFLLALLLGARRLREMVILVTAFTVAHSLTLALASLDLIRVSPAITEALIAASIVYVSAENCFLQVARHRWLLTFGFGLIHGLGFSGVLRERLVDSTGLALPVLSFNAGVELGQIAILVPVYPLIVHLRRGSSAEQTERRHHQIARIGSTALFLLGFGWLVERVTGWNFMPL